ncbi:MAG: hypothetical protein HYY02_13165 [Chloroflexi bacterium]|nr:hypothetical protein [Chloroflexota bacterium]
MEVLYARGAGVEVHKKTVMACVLTPEARTVREFGTMTQGLGESWQELLEVMDDLRAVRCDVLTIGQYLRPSKDHLPVERFYTSGEFLRLKDAGLARGFGHVESGPLVRSSYHAHEQALLT